ncbi:hypothetical protein FOMA001_g9762 [Fusarium oxysporum f. sp. matthiolae]|nr:hypothetical protein FOMA001_g9762 [Fusarium oxysporum f. sp. matthiolae]
MMDQRHGGSAHQPVLQIVFEDPQSRRVSAEPSLRLPEHFTSLLKDLSQENDQLERRGRQGLNDAEKLSFKLAQLKNLDLIHDPNQRFVLDHWQELVVIAATIVDSYLGHEDVAVLTTTHLNGSELSRDTILRDKRVVREMIKLTDHMYLHWKYHGLALELMVLLSTAFHLNLRSMFSYVAADIPLSVLRQQSTRKIQELQRLLEQCTPSPKIKSSVKLYIPFLVLLLRPEYSLVDVQNALQTSLFHMSDWDLFCKTAALEYDPVRDVWTSRKLIPSRELEMQEFIDYKGNYPVEVRVPISGFKTFEASLDLQQKAARASQLQVEGARTGPLLAYGWDDIHDAIQQQVLQDLVSPVLL